MRKPAKSTAEECEMIEQLLREAEVKGLVYDTGQRRWSETTQSYQIVWAKSPPKRERN